MGEYCLLGLAGGSYSAWGTAPDETLPDHPGEPVDSRDVMAANPRSRLGEMLLAEGVITPEQLDTALELSEERGIFLGHAMVELDYVGEEELVTFLIRQCRIPHINVADYDIKKDVVELLPREVCRQHRVLPVDHLGNMLTVAMVDPLDDAAIESVKDNCELKVKPILCSWYDFEQVFRRLFAETSVAPPQKSADEEEAVATILDKLDDEPVGELEDEGEGEDRLGEAEDADIPESEPQQSGRASSSGRRASRSRAKSDVADSSLSEALATDGSPEERREAVKAVLLGRNQGQAGRREAARDGAEGTRRAGKSARRTDEPAETRSKPRKVQKPETDSVPQQYTFDSFVPSPSNEFAFHLAQAVADAPGGEANPFFLYGDVGLGKTHLLSSITGNIAKRHKNLRLVFVSSSEFGHQLIDAVESGHVKDFRHQYATCDVIVLDDVQFLVGRDRAQEEFFAIFNHLLENGKQIVLAADKHPEELHKIDRRLVSRFVGGIVAGLEAPDWTTRIEILRERMRQFDVEIPIEVLELIATSVPDDVRKLIGALRKIIAYCTLVERDITVDVAQEVLSHLHHTPFA